MRVAEGDSDATAFSKLFCASTPHWPPTPIERTENQRRSRRGPTPDAGIAPRGAPLALAGAVTAAVCASIALLKPPGPRLMITLSRVFVYPIKSTAPVELSEAEVQRRGLANDRRHVVTDAQGRFFTARRFPRMVLIRSQILGDGLRVTAPGMPPLSLQPESYPDAYDGVRVWNDDIAGQHCGEQADAWFSHYLGKTAKLFYMGARSERPGRGGSELGFADSAPLLVLSAASVADLNTRLRSPVSIRNFRPNLVVSGSGAYAEDEWEDFSIGDARFRGLWRCSRCVLTTVDPDTGVMDAQRQPLDTLMAYRREGEEAMFGRNCSVTGPGRIRVGQPLRLG